MGRLSPGVWRKQLGTFSEREIKIALIRLLGARTVRIDNRLTELTAGSAALVPC